MQGSPSDSEGLEEILQSTSLSGRHGSTPDCPNDHDQMSGLARDHGNDDFSDDRRLPFGGFDSFINPMTGRPTTSSDGAGVGHARMRMVLVVSPMGPNENQHRPMQGIDSYQRSSPRPSDEYEASRRLPVSSLLRGGPGFGELGLAFPFSRGGQQAMFPVSPDDAFAGSSHGNLHTTGGPTITEIDDGVHDHNWQYPDRALSTGPKITELLDNDCGRASNSKHGQPKVTAHAPTKRRNKNATVIRNFPVHPEITSASNSTSVSSLDSFTSSTEHSSLNDNGTARRKHVSREKDTVDHKLPNYQDKNPGLTDLNGKSDANMLPSSQGDIHRPTVHYHVNIDDIPTDSDSETGVSDSGDDYSVDDNYDLNSLFDMELASIGNPDNEIEALNAEMKSDESNNLKHNEEHTQGMESSVKRADKYPKTTEGAEFIKPTNDNNNLDKVPTTQDSIREDHVATLHTESSSRESTETTRIANAATTECSTEIGKVTNTPSDDDVKQPQPRQDVHRSHRPHRKSTSSCQHHHTHTIHHCQNGILVHCVGCWLQWHTVCTCASPKGKRCKDKNKNMGRSQTDDSIREFTSPGASRSPHNANVGVTFDDLLHTVGLSVKEVHPDGNCLFSAVVDQLRVIGQFRHTARSLRTATVDYLERNPYQEDGTHLSAFIDHHSGDTWQQYLTNLRNEGHWGDQITVCALANVLRRRIVIYKHLGTHLDSTVVSPMAANASALDTEGRSDKSPTADTTIGLQGGLVDDDIELCLGHVDDAHYVSLRKLDWKESLNQVESMQTDVPVMHMSFAMKFILRSDVLYEPPKLQSEMLGVMFTVEQYGATDPLNAELIDIHRVSNTVPKPIALVVASDTVVRNPGTSQNVGLKDLWACCDGSKVGLTRLRPVDPVRWLPKVSPNGDLKAIGHIEIGQLAFNCEWPSICEKWLTRQRRFNWPPQDVKERIRQAGIRVVQSQATNDAQCEEGCEYEYTFMAAEAILCDSCVSPGQRDCFRIVKMVLDMMKVTRLITMAMMKHTFFYMCEEIEPSLWTSRLAQYAIMFIEKLSNNLTAGQFPNYFVNKLNMFQSQDVDNNVEIVLEDLAFARNNLFVCLYFALDFYVNISYPLARIFDRIVEDVQAYNVDHDDVSAIQRCFVPCVIDSILDSISTDQFTNAYQCSQTAVSELNSLNEQPHARVALDQLIMQVLQRCPKTGKRWLFAFYVDIVQNTQYTEAVTTDNEPVCPFADAYGRTLEDHLAASGASRRQIRLPESMITAENYVLLTLGILSIFQSLDIPAEVVMGTVKHFVKFSVPKIDAFIKDPREPAQAKHHIIQMVPLMLKIVESQMESRVLQKTINTLQGILKQRNT